MKIYIVIFIVILLIIYCSNLIITDFDITEKFISTIPKIRDVVFIDSCKNTKVDVVYNNCKHLYTKKSKFQQIDVYNHPVMGNMLAVDNDLQLTANDEKNYHEMIVHVPLNYIANAENVLIIGGGDGGTLTEVLKHKNLKKIYNVEIDKEVIIAAKKYFPQIGKSFNNPRANVVIEDAAKWLNKKIKHRKLLDFFDVVILDSTDFGVSDTLFTDKFYFQLKRVMKKRSIFTLNYESLGWYKDNLNVFKKDMGDFFKHIYIYQIYQPTFHSGHYSFAFMSDKIHPTRSLIDWESFRKKKIETNYYTQKLHYASFSLPNKIINKSLRKKKYKLGLLVTCDIQGSQFYKLNKLSNINNFFNDLIKTYSLSEVRRIYYKFTPQGLTVLSLLKESHISIHTWPEKGSASIDIFTCGKFKYNKKDVRTLETIISDYFNPKNIFIKQVDREIDIK